MKDFMKNKKEFAEYLDIPELQYGRYENSKNQPSLAMALKMSEKIKKTVNQIWFIEKE